MKMESFTKSFILMMLLLLGIGVNAQENPKRVCETKANQVIDLDVDVMGKGFSSQSGKWDYVKDNVTDVASYTDPATQTIEKNVSRMFVLTGKKSGTYKFIFTASAGNPCLAAGEKVMATVIIEEVSRDKSTALSLCPGQTGSIDLKTIISSRFPNPVFSNASAQTLSGSELSVDDKFEGDITVKYKSTNSDKICNEEATITIQVTREGKAPELKDGNSSKSIYYCVEQVPADLNLNEFLTTVGNPTGTWTVVNTGTGVVSVDAAGRASFSNPTKDDVYKFSYKFEDAAGGCYSGSTLKDAVVITIKDDLTTDFKDKETEICKQKTPHRVIDMLRDGLGVNIPLSSGTWKRIEEQRKMAIADGMFHVAQAPVGKYRYVFNVSNVDGNVCGLAGKSATLTLSILDPSIYEDARIKFCEQNINEATATNINLTDYVNNLPDDAKWVTPTGGISTTEAGVVTYADLKNAGIGTYQFNYTYAGGSCGDGEGSLYLTITDDLDVDENQDVVYCRPDMLNAIKLNALTGISVPGTWSITSGSGDLQNASAANATFAEPKGITEDATYTLKFTPTTTNCGAKEITLTIYVNKDTYTHP